MYPKAWKRLLLGKSKRDFLPLNMPQIRTIADAKRQLKIADYLLSAGFKMEPSKSNARDTWFYSPFFRQANGIDENTPSFQIRLGDKGFELWKDFGANAPSEKDNGDIIDLVRFLHRTDFKGALQELRSWAGGVQSTLPKGKSHPTKNPSNQNWEPQMQFAGAYDFLGLKGDFFQMHYICNKRGIDKRLVPIYLKKVKYKHIPKRKHFWGIGWTNESEGWEVRNAYFKGSLGSKDITVIGKKKLGNTVRNYFVFLPIFYSPIFFSRLINLP